MCEFFSAIIVPNNILYNLINDSHESIVEKYKLDDSTMSPDFVRVEYIPINKNVFNHDVKNWKMKVDQDILPDWFDKEKSENDVKELFFKVIIPEVFLIDDRKDTEIRNKKIFMKNSTAILFDDSSAELYNDSSAKLYDDSSAELYNGSSAELFGKSFARLYDDSSARLYGDSTALLYNNSTAVLFDDSSAKLYNDSSARLFGDSSAELFHYSSAELYNDSSAKLYDRSSAVLHDNSYYLKDNIIYTNYKNMKLILKEN